MKMLMLSVCCNKFVTVPAKHSLIGEEPQSMSSPADDYNINVQRTLKIACFRVL